MESFISIRPTKTMVFIASTFLSSEGALAHTKCPNIIICPRLRFLKWTYVVSWLILKSWAVISIHFEVFRFVNLTDTEFFWFVPGAMNTLSQSNSQLLEFIFYLESSIHPDKTLPDEKIQRG